MITDGTGVALEAGGHAPVFPWAGIAAVHRAPASRGPVLGVAAARPSGMLYGCRTDARRGAGPRERPAGPAPVPHHCLASRPPVR